MVLNFYYLFFVIHFIFSTFSSFLRNFNYCIIYLLLFYITLIVSTAYGVSGYSLNSGHYGIVSIILLRASTEFHLCVAKALEESPEYSI